MARRSPERDFQVEVVRLARLFGWRVFYIPDWMYRLAMASMKRMRRTDRDWPDHGFPDLVLVKPPRIIFAELKAGRNKATEDQLAWHDDLRACGLTVYVWTDTRDMDNVIAVLTRS
jgi:hypothetical protein